MSPIDSLDKPQPVVLLARPAAGGLRSHVIQLLRFSDRARFKFVLAAPSTLLHSLADVDLPPFDPLELPISAAVSPSDLVSAGRLAIASRKSRAIVHAHGIRAGLVASLAKCLGASFPLVVTFHNVPLNSKLSNVALRLIGARANAQIAVSHAIASRLLSYPKPEVIPNGVDLQYFAAASDEVSISLTVSPESIFHATVGAVARLSPEKGVDLLIEAARRTPGVRYIVAGTGPQEARLKATAPPNVQFVGYVADTRSVYAVSDMVVIPSRSEGQGIVALEAMASGTPVIAARVGGLAETIEDGVTGVLVAPENPGALADAIASLSGNAELRKSIAAAALIWVEKNGAVRQRVAEIECVYAQVAARSSSTRRS